MSDSVQREPDQLDGVPLPEERMGAVGHEAGRAGMLAQMTAGRLPGGILLHGPRGIGKATLAFEMARRIFEATGDETPVQVASQIAAGAHPNLQVLRKAPRDTGKGFYTGIRVDEVRDLIERLHRTRGRAGHRVVVIDAIDDANTSATNALLKILEEPPPETTFFLVSHRPGSLLPTIRSRCHSIALRPVSDADVAAVLSETAPGSSIDQAVRLAQGRPRRGFEALLLGDGGALAALSAWLQNPAQAPVAAELAIADTLLADKEGAQARFARDMLRDWVAAEARDAAAIGGRRRLASANQLWEKADQMFAAAEEYNLDARQTLIALLDAIRTHARQTASLTEPT